MQLEGPLRKMSTYYGEEIRYTLRLGDDLLLMNALLGRHIEISFNGNHTCFCGQLVPEVYRQNFCRECFFTKPEASPTIMKPELSQAHLGIEERDLEFEKDVQLKPHILYLAYSSNVKVGVTRKSQIPYRWIDQGAVEALVIAKTPYRQAAGLIEIALKNYISDKTNWRKMLQNNLSERSLIDVKNELTNYLDYDLKQYVTRDSDINKVNFPVIKYPSKVKSVTLDKVPQIEEKLIGIKGQYLLFDNDTVFNVRRHAGYLIQLSF